MDWIYFYYLIFLPLFKGYLVGSIPFGLILSFLFGYGDIRKIGSGNIGATNVLRTGNKTLAAATLFLDAIKGAALILLFFKGTPPFFENEHFDESFSFFYASVLGLGAVLGHCFPVWLKFKGGKGVATALGVLIAATPYAGIIACVAWLVCAKITKISSLSALFALTIAPFVVWYFYFGPAAVVITMISLIIFFRHKDNIKRLIYGTEPKIGRRNDAAPDSKV